MSCFTSMPRSLAAVTLAAGDTITDANSNDYHVLFIERQSLNNTVLAVCRPVRRSGFLA